MSAFHCHVLSDPTKFISIVLTPGNQWQPMATEVFEEFELYFHEILTRDFINIAMEDKFRNSFCLAPIPSSFLRCMCHMPN